MTAKDPSNNNDSIKPYNPYENASAPPEPEIVVDGEHSATEPDIPIAAAVPYVPPPPAGAVAVPEKPAAITTTVTTTTTTIAAPTTTASIVSGYNVQLIPSMAQLVDKHQPLRLTVKHNIWLNSTVDSSAGAVTYTDSGQPFPLRLQSSSQGGMTRVAIVDEKTMQPCAVVRKNNPTSPDKFHIFGMVPYVPNQSPSITMKYDDGRPMYTWGSLVNADGMLPYASKRKFKFIMQNGWQYVAEQQGGRLFSNSSSHAKVFEVGVQTRNTTVTQRNVRTQKSKKQSLATIQQSGQNWNVVVQPGSDHDPGLLIVLALMLDELGRSMH